MQLRHLKKCVLTKGFKEKTSNGNFKLSLEIIGTYDCQIQKVTDSISATIYGADINRMYRFSSPLKDLETYLSDKFNYSNDNVTDYYLEIIDSNIADGSLLATAKGEVISDILKQQLVGNVKTSNAPYQQRYKIIAINDNWIDARL